MRINVRRSASVFFFDGFAFWNCVCYICLCMLFCVVLVW